MVKGASSTVKDPIREPIGETICMSSVQRKWSTTCVLIGGKWPNESLLGARSGECNAKPRHLHSHKAMPLPSASGCRYSHRRQLLRLASEQTDVGQGPAGSPAYQTTGQPQVKGRCRQLNEALLERRGAKRAPMGQQLVHIKHRRKTMPLPGRI